MMTKRKFKTSDTNDLIQTIRRFSSAVEGDDYEKYKPMKDALGLYFSQSSSAVEGDDYEKYKPMKDALGSALVDLLFEQMQDFIEGWTDQENRKGYRAYTTSAYERGFWQRYEYERQTKPMSRG